MFRRGLADGLFVDIGSGGLGLEIEDLFASNFSDEALHPHESLKDCVPIAFHHQVVHLIVKRYPDFLQR